MGKCIECKTKSPSFNYEGETKALYCKKHKLDNMINVINKKCIVCKIKQPIFNYKEESKALYCGKHKMLGMVNIKSKRCIICNDKIPSYNYKGEKKALYCFGCKLDNNMVDIKSKKCIICLINQPAFNYRDELKPTHCGDCKLQHMINIKHRKCIMCENKTPNFNYIGEQALYCRDCKLDDNMINVNSKKCVICDNKRGNFNYKDEKKPTHCNDCKNINMIDIIHKKCTKCNFNRQNPKYKPLCATCYRFDNPNSDFTRNYKVKENTIMKFVKEKYSNCIMDSTISGGCSKRRPDGLIEYDLFSIIIEIDENCHKNYEDICENKRLMEIYQDLDFKPLRVIRFNPDAYKDINGKRVNSIFSLDSNNKLKVKTKKELSRRVVILLDTVEQVLEKINQDMTMDANNVKSVDVEYLFFNENE